MNEFSELKVMEKHIFDAFRWCCSCEGEWYQYKEFPGDEKKETLYWLKQANDSHRLHVEMEIWKEKNGNRGRD